MIKHKPIVERFRDSATVDTARIILAKLEQRATKLEQRAEFSERSTRQRSRDAEASRSDILARLERVELALGLDSNTPTEDSAAHLNVTRASREARATAEQLGAINQRNRTYWDAEQARQERVRR